MNKHIDCAAVFCLAAQAQREKGNFSQAIKLYEKARNAYERCDGRMSAAIGLTFMDIANCYGELGDAEASEAFFAKARDIMRTKAEILSTSPVQQTVRQS
jgi:tetratricopeptide (TPR) repeat protein